MLSITLVGYAALAGWTSPAVASFQLQNHEVQQSTLGELALQKVLSDASPIFGSSSGNEPSTATWMKAYSDDTEIVHMNIPGTHDTATWNFSLATQASLLPVVDLVNISQAEPEFYRCQDSSVADMLAAGIRVFDLRYAYDVTKTTLVFWHGNALQSETATVDDVLYGYYNWIDQHSSEALFLSFQHEGGNDDNTTQLMLYNALTSPAAKQYIVQTRGALGTLGEARGKITLLRRFDLDQLPPSYEASIPGLHFSPQNWTDNGPAISLTYNTSTSATAYIEDYYFPITPHGSPASANIAAKLNATTTHLRLAAGDAHPDSLFWGFASSTNTLNFPPDTPRIQALGNGTLTPDGGVNQQLMPFLQGMKGKRLGIVMFDFYEQPSGLVPLFLSLGQPGEKDGGGGGASGNMGMESRGVRVRPLWGLFG